MQAQTKRKRKPSQNKGLRLDGKPDKRVGKGKRRPPESTAAVRVMPIGKRFQPGQIPAVPFKNGYDPRRAGSGNRNPAWSIMRWIEELGSVLPDGKMKYPVEALTLLEDGDDHWKAAAAGIVMRIRKGAGPECFSKAGIPLAANDLDRIFDRFVGKPVQSVITAKAELPPAEALEALGKLIGSNPAVAQLLESMLAQAKAGAQGSMDAAARPALPSAGPDSNT